MEKGMTKAIFLLLNLKAAFIRIEIVHSAALNVVNAVFGWIYFTVWSMSLYPQVYENWRRKSVVGLIFDYVLYNIIGFLADSFFNVGIFWVPSIREVIKGCRDAVRVW